MNTSRLRIKLFFLVVKIIFMYHNIVVANIHLKYDLKGNISTNQRSNIIVSIFDYLLDVHVRLLIFQKFTSN